MKINPTRDFTWLQDPGHGWLSVPIAYLLDVCTPEEIRQISSYSYINGKTVYLEEDADSAVFITAFKRKYNTFNYKFSHTDKRSSVRGYNRFAPEDVLNVVPKGTELSLF